MRRFMGMMPSSEIQKEQRFKDRYGLTIIVQAGAKGWTVIWADHSTSYRDVEASVSENWQAALAYLSELGFHDLTPTAEYRGEQ